MADLPPPPDLPEIGARAVTSWSRLARTALIVVAALFLASLTLKAVRPRLGDPTPADPTKAYAGCTVFDRADCEAIARAVAYELEHRDSRDKAEAFLRGMATLQVFPAGAGAWLMTSYRLDDRYVWIGTAVVHRSFFGFDSHWSVVGGFFINDDGPPDPMSGHSWYDPVGLRREGVPDGLIGFADPTVTSIQTFGAGGVLVDSDEPQDGFFQVDAPLPGQIAIWRSDRLLSTQSQVQGTPGAAPRTPTTSEEAPADALAAGDRIVESLLRDGAAEMAPEVWLDPTSRGTTEALSAILRPGDWHRTTAPFSRGLVGLPDHDVIVYPIEGPGGSGYLGITIQRVNDLWRLEGASYGSAALPTDLPPSD
jgi:hypothetical protein